jgi:hypothetical protein
VVGGELTPAVEAHLAVRVHCQVKELVLGPAVLLLPLLLGLAAGIRLAALRTAVVLAAAVVRAGRVAAQSLESSLLLVLRFLGGRRG